MTIHDLARTDVITATADHTAADLATVMREENVGSVVIVEDDQPVGIVTDRDLVMGVLESGADLEHVPAGDVMTGDLVSIHGDSGLLEATERMAAEGVRRLPVVDRDGALTGIVTLDDLANLLSAELANLTSIIEAESPPY